MKLAVVIPWFGRDLKGGAEQQAWQLAARLAARGHEIEVLTTCCRSHQDDWSTNHLRAGVTNEPEGFAIRRFPVVPRDRAAFDKVCGYLLSLKPDDLKPGISPVVTEDAAIFADELIKSPELLLFLSDHHWNYDWVLFLPYLYGPILHGISIVGERAAFQPCLHDEAYAYLPQVAEAFSRCGKLLFNSDGERELAAKLFGPAIWPKSIVVGEGVETLGQSTAELNGSSNGQDPYVLYLGRRDAGKNVPLLLNAFRRFKATRPNSKLRLLLAGNGAIDVNGHKDVEDLGLVAEETKETLLSNCTALFQPSQNESFSRVMMEAWMHARPVAAHSLCLATAVAVDRSGGGWVAGTEDEWAAVFAEVARTPSRQLSILGERGRSYARELADWDRVMERYEQSLGPRPAEARVDAASADLTPATINQCLPNLSYGDAISNHAIWIRDQLRRFGFRSDIYVRYIDPRVGHECRVFSPEALHASDGVIYHHSIGTEITPHLLEFTGPKCIVYHNITPAEFFVADRPGFAHVLRTGREELPTLAPHFDIAVGDSSYNVEELEADGFHQPSVLSIAVDPKKWNFPPDPKLVAAIQDGNTNILFVGRISPNKKQDDLVRAFHEYLSFDPTARLIIVGKAEDEDPYAAHLLSVIRELGVGGSVFMPGSITDAELAACYRNAHLFWSMSEHEGFCVPLIEAMWFDVPVLAFNSSAVPETLGEAAMMFTHKNDLRELAAVAHFIVTDRELRSKIISAQQRQREKFLPDEVAPRVVRIANDLRLSLDRPALRKARKHWPQLLPSGEVATINQVLPNLSCGDAISTQALVIRDTLRGLGYRSDIFARYRDEQLVHDCHVFSLEALESSPAIIYHHSIGSDLTKHVSGYDGPKALIYHNITPAEYHDTFDPSVATMLRDGRAELKSMAAAFPVSYGVSAFNAAELAATGFENPRVLPCCIDPARLKVESDAATMSYLDDGKTNVLFVGRMCPNKKQDDLVRAFEQYVELDANARLVMVGSSPTGDAYAAYVDELVKSLGLQESVVCPGFVSEAELMACYRTASLFWSMSEHEGFCVPLVEAMWFDVPVLAFASSAIPETLDGAGRIFSDKQDLAAIAQLARKIITDASVREEIIVQQRKRRLAFAPETFEPQVEQLARELRLACASQAGGTLAAGDLRKVP